MGEHIGLKKSWGILTGVQHDVRDQILDIVRCWLEAGESRTGRLIGWFGVTASKLYSRRERYGRADEHNRWVPRDFWLEDWEKQAIIGFHLKNPMEGCRRLTFLIVVLGTLVWSENSIRRIPRSTKGCISVRNFGTCGL
jgi:putative transposase